MKILEHIDLAPYTTFKVGGKARYFCAAESEADLLAALEFARERGLRTFVLGGGSNILVGDGGFDGLVIKMEMKGVAFEGAASAGDALVTAAAGEGWDDLVALTVGRGLWGLENLSAIPGTVGAAPVQNIGAYGVEAKDAIESVRAVHAETGAARSFTNAECRFSYRESFFKTAEGKKWIIVSVTFRLSEKPRPNLSYKDLKDFFAPGGERSKNQHLLLANNLQEANVGFSSASARAISVCDIREAVIVIRSRKFPDLSQVGTAGSFWKNPIIPLQQYESLKAKYPDLPSFPAGIDKTGTELVKIPLAWILDRVCDLKGHKGSVGGGEIALFQNQPLVLVATKGATAADISDFANGVADMVRQKTGIEIEREVGGI